MARQTSERRIRPQAPITRGVTQGVESPGGGKATPVNQQTRQLGLPLGTAEQRERKLERADGQADLGPPRPATCAVPPPSGKDKLAPSATMEQVCKHLEQAFQNVASNQGAPGPDRQSIEQVRQQLSKLLPKLRSQLLEGTYQPGNIRRVWIEKSGGGQRGLGIPNVIDRVVQEAVRLVLEPVYEPTFHEESHGFRPGRSCHTAIAQAYEHIDQGYEWVVDIDLEKFFDGVNHQRLMARLAERLGDRPLRELMGRMLKAKVVLPDGVVVSNEQGVPQGGPLSPLLSNIVLDELDQELHQRGHRFVRYADDCNIYVRSERAGQRVLDSVVDFIQRRLRLKVNAAKSAVARPEERHFLGFRLRRDPREGEVQVLLSKRSQERIAAKIRELTPRAWGNSLAACIQELNVYLVGWIGFFCIVTQAAERTLELLDGHIRRRLRAIQLKHWKTKQTTARRLAQRGVSRKLAWQTTYRGRKSLWAQSQSSAIHQALRNAYFADRGLISLVDQWKQRAKPIVVPVRAPR